MARHTELTITERPIQKLTRMERARHAVRSWWTGPITSNSPEIARLWASPPTAAGVPVNEYTALNLSAVWSATQLISNDIASLPLMLYKRLPSGGKQKYDDHRLFPLVHDRPNPEMSSYNWRRVIQAHVLIWGNGYCEIERDQVGRPVNIWPLSPDRVMPSRDRNGTLVYRVQNASGGETQFPAANIIHIRGLSYDGVLGYSMVSKARESLSIGMAAEKFGGALFGNGLTVGGVITYDTNPPDDVKKNNREALNARYQGVENAHKWLALYGGAKFQKLNVEPNDAQFLETREFQVREISRYFNIPPHKLGDVSRGSSFASIEQQNQDYLSSCLRPILTNWEEELEMKLIAPAERRIQFFEHVTEALLRADHVSRGEFYSKLWAVGALTANEIRERENMPPIEGGDVAYIPVNMQPADRVNEVIDANIESKTTPPQQPHGPAPQDAVDAANNRQRIAELEEEVALARRKAQEAEAKRDETIAEADGARDGYRTHAGKLIAELDECRQHIEKKLTPELRQVEYERDAARETVAERDGEIAGLRVDLNQMTVARDAQIAEVQRVTAEWNNAVKVLAAEILLEREAREKAEGLTHQAQEETIAERQAAEAAAGAAAARQREQAEAFSLDVTAERERATKAEAAVIQQTARAEAAEANTRMAEAIMHELRSRLEEQGRDLDAAQADVISTREALARAEAEKATADDWRTAAMQTAEEHSQRADLATALLDETRQAIKSLCVDAVNRLITKETDRARKQQGSPDKLRKWAETFYPMHADTVRATLKPVLRAWLVARGLPLMLDQVLEETTAAYIEESTRHLSGLAAEHDHDSLAPALERVLRRWEADRAEAVTESILRRAA